MVPPKVMESDCTAAGSCELSGTILNSTSRPALLEQALVHGDEARREVHRRGVADHDLGALRRGRLRRQHGASSAAASQAGGEQYRRFISFFLPGFWLVVLARALAARGRFRLRTVPAGAIGQLAQQHVGGDADVRLERLGRLGLVAAEHGAHQDAVLGHHHLAREGVAPEQQAVARRLHVELVAELLDRAQRAGGDERAVEALVARSRTRARRAARRRAGGDTGAPAGEKLVTISSSQSASPCSMASFTASISTSWRERVMSARCAALSGGTRKPFWLSCCTRPCAASCASASRMGLRADAVALLEDAQLELAVGLQRAGDDVAPQQPHRHLRRGRVGAGRRPRIGRMHRAGVLSASRVSSRQELSGPRARAANNFIDKTIFADKHGD